MKYSGIGGQAVMEGVMMRNGDKYAVAVRKPDKEIVVEKKDYKGVVDSKWNKIPLVRGVISFVDSLILGMSTLMFSASFFEEEEEEKPKKKKGKQAEEKILTEEDIKKQEEKAARQEKAMMTGVLIFSIVMAIAIFMILPYYLSAALQKVVDNQTVVSIFEGIIRLVIFIAYILLISRMKDIQRVFMYHGAEHKCINCIEHGLDLTVENVKKSSKEHKRCGTSFLVFVVVISIILYLFIRVDSHALRVIIRLLLIPVIAGVSYELLRAAGRHDNAVMRVLSKPGMWMQQLTTKEPDEDMIEVGIASVEAVFDWRAYQKENFGKEFAAENGQEDAPEKSAAVENHQEAAVTEE